MSDYFYIPIEILLPAVVMLISICWMIVYYFNISKKNDDQFHIDEISIKTDLLDNNYVVDERRIHSASNPVKPFPVEKSINPMKPYRAGK